jgi:hypothetical protein
VKPTFIGLGGQKCASSWLHAIFADHPQAYVSTPKELDFFSSHFERGFQWYERHFTAATPDHLAIGEISPSYLPDSDAPARAHAYNPQLRILVALRDPVERAYSNFLHDVRLGYYRSGTPSFEEALANNPMYVEQSRYARHLRRWMQYFPASQFLIVLQEEIHQKPSDLARQVYRFLAISTRHESTSVARRANESYLPKSRSTEQLIRTLGRTVRKSGFGWLDRAARRSGIIAAIHRKNRLDIRSLVQPMQDETRSMLNATLAEDTRDLLDILGRHALPWPSYTSGQASAEHVHRT